MDTTEARAIDRALNAARDPREMASLISRRRLVRARMAFEQAMEQFERDVPLPPIRDSFPFVIR
jgi:hypothetical protein